MRGSHVVVFLLFLIFFDNSLYAHTDALAVVEENAGRVSFYHLENGKSLGSLKVGFLPHEITISKDGKTAYVSNFGIKDYDSGLGIPGASISVIDIKNHLEKYRLYTFEPSEHRTYAQIDSAPHGVKLRPPLEKQLYVNVEKGNKIIVFDLASRSIVKKIPISSNTHNIFFSPDGKILWLMAGKDGVIRMNPDTGEVTGKFILRTPVRGLKYTADQRSLMISAVNQIVFIDPITLTTQKKFNNLGVGTILYSDMTPNKKYIVAPAVFDNQILIINVKTGKIVKRIVTGLNPVTVLIDSAGKFAYVTNATNHHITKINMNDFTLTKLDTKDGPNGLAFVSAFTPCVRKSLLLGVALPLSGKDGFRGRDMMRGYEYWRLLLEKAGGLLIKDQAYDVSIVYLDTQSEPENISKLTQELITQYHVNMLLSTYGVTAYNIEKQLALENHIPLTPAIINERPWLPNDIAFGKDFFITTKNYGEKYYAQYSFNASTYSASATAIGIILQKSILTTDNLDYVALSKVLEKNKFNVFYEI